MNCQIVELLDKRRIELTSVDLAELMWLDEDSTNGRGSHKAENNGDEDECEDGDSLSEYYLAYDDVHGPFLIPNSIRRVPYHQFSIWMADSLAGEVTTTLPTTYCFLCSLTPPVSLLRSVGRSPRACTMTQASDQNPLAGGDRH